MLTPEQKDQIRKARQAQEAEDRKAAAHDEAARARAYQLLQASQEAHFGHTGEEKTRPARIVSFAEALKQAAEQLEAEAKGGKVVPISKPAAKS